MSREALTPAEEQEIEVWLVKCRDDELFALENLVTIVDKNRNERLMALWQSQRDAIEFESRINLEVKARQEGRTTLHLGRAMVKARFRQNFYGLIFAHEEEAAPVLFDKAKFIDDHFPEAIQGEKVRDQAKAIRYKDSNSLVRITTAGQTEAVSSKKGRSGDPDWVHVTEAAYITYLDELLRGVLPSLPPHGRLIMESTSNGPRGTFYAKCWEVKTKGRELVPGRIWRLGEITLKFSGFQHHEEYRLEGTWDGAQDDEERRLEGLGVTPPSLLWRRRKLQEIANDPKRKNALDPIRSFKREYPATLEEAFEESGSNYFRPPVIRALKEFVIAQKREPLVAGLMRQNGQRPKLIPEYPDNRFLFWELPEDGYEGRYVVFGDCGAGNANSDPDSGYVLDRLKKRFVAAYWGQLGATVHAQHLLALAEFYHGAWINWDGTGLGAELRPLLLDSGYPLSRIYHRRARYNEPKPEGWTPDYLNDRDGFGFLFTQNTRMPALSLLRFAIEGQTHTMPDLDWYDEAQQFGFDEDGKGPAAAQGYTDDKIMSSAGCMASDAELPAPTQAIPLKPFQSANKLREKLHANIMNRVRQPETVMGNDG